MALKWFPLYLKTKTKQQQQQQRGVQVYKSTLNKRLLSAWRNNQHLYAHAFVWNPAGLAGARPWLLVPPVHAWGINRRLWLLGSCQVQLFVKTGAKNR